jgi:hypothetical protein
VKGGVFCLRYHEIGQTAKNRKSAQPDGARFLNYPDQRLLDLGFLELDMFSDNRVILCLGHLVGHRTAVLRRDVEGTGVGCRQQLDLDSGSLGHGRPAFNKMNAADVGYGSTANSGAKLRIPPEKSSPLSEEKQPYAGK